MPRPIRLLPLAAVAIMALQLPSVALANAYRPTAKVTHAQARMMSRATTTPSSEIFTGREAARAADPVAQGGTTGGEVNPGTDDGLHHGYNGG